MWKMCDDIDFKMCGLAADIDSVHQTDHATWQVASNETMEFLIILIPPWWRRLTALRANVSPFPKSM